MRRAEIYTQPDCQPCLATIRWMNHYDVIYNRLPAADYLDFLRLRLGYNTAPVVVVYDKGRAVDHWAGYRPEKLSQWFGDFAKETAA